MHVSGLPDVVDPATGKPIDPRGEAASWDRVTTLPMQFAPGQGYAYNQTNYLLLGRIIDKLRGRPFTEVVKEREFIPAGMASATYSDSSEIVPGRAVTYTNADFSGPTPKRTNVLKLTYFEYPRSLRTGAGLTTTAEEVARWMIALRDNKLISEATRKEMWTTGKMPDGKPTVWALGWPAFPREQHPAVAGIGGAMAAFYYYPDDDVGLVILTNLQGGQPEQFIEQVAQLYGSDPS
jgi:CubicO group peptidase (beta-lactamase class C family)